MSDGILLELNLDQKTSFCLITALTQMKLGMLDFQTGSLVDKKGKNVLELTFKKTGKEPNLVFQWDKKSSANQKPTSETPK